MRVPLWCAASLIGALSACRSTRAPASHPHGATASTTVVAPGHGSRIVVDVSESNRGFAAGNAVALETLHRVLEDALSSLQWNNPFQRCRLDETLRCGTTPLTAHQLQSPALYNGRAAALDAVLRHPHADAHAELADPLDPYALTVLVTDGFQSRNGTTPSEPTAPDDVACAAGADPECVAALLRRRVDEGYGVWLIRLQMPFNGRYFAERRLDASTWQRVQAHVASLQTDPAWEGTTFSASGVDLTSAAGPFTFVGARPLLLFVLSRDIPRARQFVGEVTRRLQVERITARRRDEDIASSEWAPFEGLTATIDTVRRADEGGSADEVIVEQVTRTAGGVEVPARCTLRGRSRLRITGATHEGSVAPPSFARVTFDWRLLPHAVREITLPTDVVPAIAGGFTTTFGLDCMSLPAGEFAYTLALGGRWTLDDEAFARMWFVTESGETSFETPERVYGLASLARAVIGDAIRREGVLDQVVLRVRRE